MTPIYMFCDGSFGCDCLVKRAAAERKKQRTHGSVYMSRKCSCPPCRKTKARKMREWRAAKKENN